MERKEELLQKFGEQVSAFRKKKGLSVRELADAAGLNILQVQKIEAGKLNFHLSTVIALAAGLKISPGELLRAL
jgi:transcriptional regulator with XRE-family HTH domain